MMEKVQSAMRVLLASTIVQGCEAVDENLARWFKALPTMRRRRTGQ